MKKHLSVLLSLILCIGIFVACDNGEPSESETTSALVTTESENTTESATAENTENDETAGTTQTTETSETTEATTTNTQGTPENVETT